MFFPRTQYGPSVHLKLLEKNLNDFSPHQENKFSRKLPMLF